MLNRNKKIDDAMEALKSHRRRSYRTVVQTHRVGKYYSARTVHEKDGEVDSRTRDDSRRNSHPEQ